MAQEIEVKKQSPLQEIRTTMESPEMRQQIKMALPAHVNVDKFIRVITTAVANEPRLLEAGRLSFYNACMKAAADGLVPDGKEAALVTFGSEVSYMPMVAGILKKIRNSGELESIYSEVVHKSDKFKFQPGIDSVPDHQPEWFEKRGDAIGVYAVAKTKDGGVYVEIMNKEQVMAIRAVAKTKNIWDGAFGLEKWKVACIRRLSKRLPMSTDLEEFQKEFDDDIDLDDKPTPTPIAPVPETSSRLAAAVTTPQPAAQPRPAPAAPQPPKPAAAKPPAAQPRAAAPAPEEPNEAPLSEVEEDQVPI